MPASVACSRTAPALPCTLAMMRAADAPAPFNLSTSSVPETVGRMNGPLTLASSAIDCHDRSGRGVVAGEVAGDGEVGRPMLEVDGALCRRAQRAGGQRQLHHDGRARSVESPDPLIAGRDWAGRQSWKSIRATAPARSPGCADWQDRGVHPDGTCRQRRAPQRPTRCALARWR